jgi:hypothetical protein
MIRVPEVDFGVNAAFPGGIQEIQSEQEQIVILFTDAIKTAEIHTELQ